MVTPTNLTVKTFVSVKPRISMLTIAFFFYKIIIYEVLLKLSERLLTLRQLLTPTSSLITVAWPLLMSVDLEAVINSHQFPDNCGMATVDVTIGCKYCCIFCNMNKTKWTKKYVRIYMSLIYIIKGTGPTSILMEPLILSLTLRNCSFWLRNESPVI